MRMDVAIKYIVKLMGIMGTDVGIILDTLKKLCFFMKRKITLGMINERIF